MNGKLLVKYLWQSDYDPKEIEFLRAGFTEGFDIGYRGPVERQSRASNIPLRIGSKTELWNKLIKEVKNLRVAGLFDSIAYENYIQSPIGLVPKAGGQNRLIFHLSYNFGEHDNEKSLNFHTPAKMCSVRYEDLDCAARTCIRVKAFKMRNLNLFMGEDADSNKFIFLGKSDIKSAFRLLGLKKSSWKWLIMKAQNPVTGKWQYFVDKCLPFGSSISCAHFQRFSDALKHLIQYRTAMDSINNYLDDFLFIAETMIICNYLIQQFLDMCEELGIPITLEKTEWASIRLIFLGILLDGEFMTFVIPEEKRLRLLTW